MPTPGDLLNTRFEKSGFSGYKATDVDRFMAEMAAAVSRSNHEMADLKRKLEAAQGQILSLKEEEESIKNTLLNAQRLADRIVKDAQQKAEITIRDAQIKAEKLIETADMDIELRHSEAERIKHEVSDFKLKVMRMYRTHIELINSLPSETDNFDSQEPVDIQPLHDDEASIVQAETELEAAPTVQECPTSEIENQQDLGLQQRPEDDKTDTEAPVLKLNLRYNDNTGEYEPISLPSDIDISENSAQKRSSGIKFGSNYDITTDSFKGKQ